MLLGLWPKVILILKLAKPKWVEKCGVWIRLRSTTMILLDGFRNLEIPAALWIPRIQPTSCPSQTLIPGNPIKARASELLW